MQVKNVYLFLYKFAARQYLTSIQLCVFPKVFPNCTRLIYCLNWEEGYVMPLCRGTSLEVKECHACPVFQYNTRSYPEKQAMQNLLWGE